MRRGAWISYPRRLLRYMMLLQLVIFRRPRLFIQIKVSVVSSRVSSPNVEQQCIIIEGPGRSAMIRWRYNNQVYCIKNYDHHQFTQFHGYPNKLIIKKCWGFKHSNSNATSRYSQTLLLSQLLATSIKFGEAAFSTRCHAQCTLIQQLKIITHTKSTIQNSTHWLNQKLSLIDHIFGISSRWCDIF